MPDGFPFENKTIKTETFGKVEPNTCLHETSRRKCRCIAAGMHEPGQKQVAHPLGRAKEGRRFRFLHGEEFNHKPTDEEIRSTVTAWYNRETDKAILSGFIYEGIPVWLSSENQFNYKAAYDLAVQTGGRTCQ